MSKTKSKNGKRRLAALKGWKTRRANQRKRSLAAKKGWKTRRKNTKKAKIDPAKAVKKVLDELNLPLGGPFSGENGIYKTSGEFSGPPEYLVSILITGEEGDEKIIRKRIRPTEDSEIIEFEPGWETIGKTF